MEYNCLESRIQTISSQALNITDNPCLHSLHNYNIQQYYSVFVYNKQYNSTTRWSACKCTEKNSNRSSTTSTGNHLSMSQCCTLLPHQTTCQCLSAALYCPTKPTVNVSVLHSIAPTKHLSISHCRNLLPRNSQQFILHTFVCVYIQTRTKPVMLCIGCQEIVCSYTSVHVLQQI